jgi:predicted N-acyltransferase
VSSIRIVTAPSIRDIEPLAWDRLAGPDAFFQSHGWLASVERDRTARCRYLLALVDGCLVGALPIYRQVSEYRSFYLADRFQRLLGLDGDYLLAGARRGFHSTVLRAADVPETVRDDIDRALLEAGLATAREEGLRGVVIPFMPTSELERAGRVVAVRAAYDSADAVIADAGDGVEALLGRLSAKRRYTSRKELRIYGAAGWRTGAESLTECLSEAARLVTVVEHRHGHPTHDFLVRRMFRRQLSAVGREAAVLTCRDAQGELVGCTVNYPWHDTLYNHTVGLDYARLRDSYEYFNLLIYRAVQHAAANGLGRVHLSIATRAKLQRGAIARPLWTAALLLDDRRLRSGVRLVDPDGMRRGIAQLGEFSHAFLSSDWTPTFAER